MEFHDIFACHRFDIGVNEEFTVKVTPKDEPPAYSQSLPTPVNLKEDILVELALLHKYGIVTTLPFSKSASPIFAQKNPNGKLRLLVDLRKNNNLISDDYVNSNHPVSTLKDAAEHMAAKKLLCKLDCSQANHCLPMADQKSIEMLDFNFANSFMRECLYRVIKADQCAHYMDDIGIAAIDANHLITNLRATFECIREAELKLSMHNCGTLAPQKWTSLGEKLPLKEKNPKRKKLPISWKKQKFSSPRRTHNAMLASSITTGTTYRDYPKN